MLESLIAARTLLAPAAPTIASAAIAATTALTATSMAVTAAPVPFTTPTALARARVAPAPGVTPAFARLFLASRSRLVRPAAFVPRLTASTAAVRLGMGAGR